MTASLVLRLTPTQYALHHSVIFIVLEEKPPFAMVFFFLSTVSEPPTVLFMGRDKHENEDLIKWGWPEDVWFHVDKVSSAHVYLRLGPGQTLDTVRNY